jgi:serine/threonine protein kinase
MPAAGRFAESPVARFAAVGGRTYPWPAMSFMQSSGHELAPGDSLGPYRIEELLGEGGMGLVFRAVRESDGEVVALKVMRFELIEDPVFGRRFEQEARAAAEVTEPHLVPVLEAGQAEGRRFLASKFIDGKTLDEKLDDGPLEVGATATYAQHVGAGLSALHEAGIVHRDLKPSNIIIDADGTAMLTDFGLAKGRAYTVLTKPGQVMGTLDYLAPELVKGSPATPATDIYALGCTIYECIAGQPPFGDREGIQVGLAHVAEPPPDLSEFRDDLPPGFAAAVATALAKDPDQRPQSAVEYGRLLAEAAG